MEESSLKSVQGGLAAGAAGSSWGTEHARPRAAGLDPLLSTLSSVTAAVDASGLPGDLPVCPPLLVNVKCPRGSAVLQHYGGKAACLRIDDVATLDMSRKCCSEGPVICTWRKALHGYEWYCNMQSYQGQGDL